jgi:hypothetical protein
MTRLLLFSVLYGFWVTHYFAFNGAEAKWPDADVKQQPYHRVHAS